MAGSRGRAYKIDLIALRPSSIDFDWSLRGDPWHFFLYVAARGKEKTHM
jgi:hypothetical protein